MLLIVPYNMYFERTENKRTESRKKRERVEDELKEKKKRKKKYERNKNGKRRGKGEEMAVLATEYFSFIITVLLEMAFSPKPQRWASMRESMDPTHLAGLQPKIPTVISLLATSASPP